MINKKPKMSRKKKTLFLFILIVFLILMTINVLELIIEGEGYRKPDYDKIDISQILSKKLLSEEDYKTLFYQTGLGRAAIDDLLKRNNGKDKIIEFQENFFTEQNVLCEKIGIITSQESFVNNKGEYKYGFELAPYENGYVLITKATHSLGWRHGHAAIVTDAVKGETLEAVILGQNSQFQNINKWRMYPSFMMLKLKDTTQETLDKISEIAKENMYDIPYGLTTGLFSKKNPSLDHIKDTQCSHLVWYPFMQAGYDIDSDGFWLVTPKDIANSDLFEVVQIYGVDPKEIWP